jgi:hypothetical protein
MNYTELVAAIEAYAENYDSAVGGFVENIPVFVKQAEQRIYNTVQLPSLRKNVTGTLTSGNKYLSAPNDYLATYSLAVINADGSYSYLLKLYSRSISDSNRYWYAILLRFIWAAIYIPYRIKFSFRANTRR